MDRRARVAPQLHPKLPQFVEVVLARQLDVRLQAVGSGDVQERVEGRLVPLAPEVGQGSTDVATQRRVGDGEDLLFDPVGEQLIGRICGRAHRADGGAECARIVVALVSDQDQGERIG